MRPRHFRLQIPCMAALMFVVSGIVFGQTAGEAAQPSTGLTQAAAVELYRQYRKALVDGDYNAFLSSVYTPGKPEGMAPIPADQTPKEFTMMKGFLLALSPDLAAAKILRFEADDRAAVLVARVDPDNKDYVTLRAFMFAADRGSWKVIPKNYDDTFPRKGGSADEKTIHEKLKDNPQLQLAAAVAEAEGMKAGPSKHPKPAGEHGKTEPAPRKPGKTAEVKRARAISDAFNDSPEHQAIVKTLKAAGNKEMLQTASSVAMVSGSDSATATISYSHEGESARAELFLFKEGDTWVAFLDLPTRKDHSLVFTTLAQRYCLPRYKALQAVSLIDDTWQGKDRQARTVNLVCSELIDKQWQDHRLALIYEYDAKDGWHITGEAAGKQTAASGMKKPAVSSKPAAAKSAATSEWADAKADIDSIRRYIGGDPQPVFIQFGRAAKRFIQFHYVTEKGSTDIKTVDWQAGKMKGPQASRLARPCPPIPFDEIDFDLVAGIFDDLRGKARPGDMMNVNLSRRNANGCQEPIWQGIATSAKHALTVTYSLDGKQTDIADYSF